MFVKSLLITFVSIAATQSAFAEHGGISGGGGGTSVPVKTDLVSIKQSASQAKLPIIAFLNEEEWRFKQLNSGMSDKWQSLSPKLFNGTVTIFDIINRTSVEVRETAPCLDSNRTEVDGSVFSKYAESICISSYRLVQKLDAYNYDYETSALVLHELSHLLGATEEEAVSIQVAFILNMRTSPYARVQSVIWSAASPLGTFGNELYSEGDNARTRLPDCKFNPKYVWKLADWKRDLESQGNYHPLRAAARAKLENQLIRLEMVSQYICSIDVTNRFANDSVKFLDIGFAGDKQVNLETFAVRNGQKPFAVPLPTEMEDRPDSNAFVASRLNSVSSTLFDDSQSMAHLSGRWGGEIRNSVFDIR